MQPEDCLNRIYYTRTMKLDGFVIVHPGGRKVVTDGTSSLSQSVELF